MFATWVSLHYNLYKMFVKLATFKVSYLKKVEKWRKLMLMNTFCAYGIYKRVYLRSETDMRAGIRLIGIFIFYSLCY